SFAAIKCTLRHTLQKMQYVAALETRRGRTRTSDGPPARWVPLPAPWSAEESVHDLGAAAQFGHDYLPVDRLGRGRAPVPDQVGDVLQRRPVGAEQGHKGMAHLPRHPVGAQARGLGDLPELAEHVMTIKRRADS